MKVKVLGRAAATLLLAWMAVFALVWYFDSSRTAWDDDLVAYKVVEKKHGGYSLLFQMLHKECEVEVGVKGMREVAGPVPRIKDPAVLNGILAATSACYVVLVAVGVARMLLLIWSFMLPAKEGQQDTQGCE